MKADFAFEFTSFMVNEHRIDEENLLVSRSALMNHFHRINPAIKKLKNVVRRISTIMNGLMYGTTGANNARLYSKGETYLYSKLNTHLLS